MIYRDNIKAILEANFIGFDKRYLDNVCDRICEMQPTEKTYEDGLNDAWEIAQKVTNDYTIKELRKCGLVLYDETLDNNEYKYSCKLIAEYPVSEVKTKIEEYEKQHEPENKKEKTFGEVFEENFKPFKVVKDYAGYKIYKNETDYNCRRCWFAISDETWNEPVGR